MNPLEIEFKYNATNISLVKFKEFCKSRPTEPVKYIEVSGYDHFYGNLKDPSAFCRHRVGPETNQLTFKRKLSNDNNYVRTEHNIDLAESTTKESIQSLCYEFGFKYNTSIFKTCFIYVYDFYTLVYYSVYQDNMNEIGRFVEIEMREDYPWKNREDAYAALTDMEKLCSKGLGISPQARIKKSLFELFGEK